ncbi:MAG: FAD-binding protein, partial [Angelakisella sp.]
MEQTTLYREQTETDVLVMGAGLAGISAAIAAAEAGARVTLVSSSMIFSGSSFYPGTWGLGLIAPENDSDIDNLADAITRLGEGMATPVLVETFTANIQRYINKLEAMGCQLKRPADSGQREYIPCFDDKNRNWYGIMQQQSVGVLADRMEALGIVQLPYTEVVDLVKHGDRVCGALALRSDGSLLRISCGAVVLAGGGMGGIFRHQLNTSDITGVGQFLALYAGASLVNTEFFQIFLGFIDPVPKTIYNEKMFRYTNFCHTGSSRDIFAGLPDGEREHLLEQRSTHGPFTARLVDRKVDRIIAEVLQQDEHGVEISYSDRIRSSEQRPEFITTYFEWLKDKKHLTIDDKVRLGLFAHASNGGIVIDTHGYTGVPGLFACGEATGGMHGADRIGGLSTANCLVFGNRAGEAAAVFSREAHGTPC